MANIFGNNADNLLLGTIDPDLILGLGGNDTLVGGQGADLLDGGSGIDLASYAASFEGVTVNLVGGTGLGGTAAGDQLVGIENVTGSGFSDSLGGDAAGNTLNGLGGNDRLAGRGGADTLSGGSGNDILNGASGADRPCCTKAAPDSHRGSSDIAERHVQARACPLPHPELVVLQRRAV